VAQGANAQRGGRGDTQGPTAAAHPRHQQWPLAGGGDEGRHLALPQAAGAGAVAGEGDRGAVDDAGAVGAGGAAGARDSRALKFVVEGQARGPSEVRVLQRVPR
jgi:hypothetical protein